MQTKILLSIKPVFAEKIFEGTKQYEFRKSLFRDKNVSKVVVYASTPVKKVIGEFEIDHVLSSDPEDLWLKTKEFAGIEKDFFDKYFQNSKIGYAIKIKNATRYLSPLDLKSGFNIERPPQSFAYLS